MPIYEYACTSCGERTEAKQSFTDPPLEECPHCGGKLRKLYSPVAIVFKGSGFYSTDAKKGKAPTSSKDDKTSKGESKESKESKGGESKESKGESKESKGESKSDKKRETSARKKEERSA
ncbi:zinc ribbon domain-containing protein [soil metagenome]